MIKRLLGLFHKTSPWYERYFIWLVVGSAVIAMAISLGIGLMQSVWFDEAYSILLAKQPVADLIHLTSVDTHPPLYYLLLKLWVSIFGWGEFALRSLSVVAMGGAVAVGALLVRRLFGIKAALATLPFLVLAPFLLRYGFEVRMYSLASFIGVSATYVLVAALDKKTDKKRWLFYLAYAALVALGTLTLYYTVLLWAAHLVWLIWLSVSKKEPVFKQKWWFAYIGAVVFFLPWLPTFLKQITNGALAPISQQLTADNMVGIVSFWFLYQPAWQLNGILSLFLLAVFIGVTYILVQAWKVVNAKQKAGLMLLIMYVAVPVAMIALISLAKPMYVERYLAHVLIGFGLLLGVATWLFASKRMDKARLLSFGLFAVLFLGVSQLVGSGNYNFQRLQHPQVKQAASIVDCSKGPLLAADPYVATELSYYKPNCDIRFYSDTADLRGGYAPFANSNLRTSDAEKDFAFAKRLTYVYYDKPELSLPHSLYLNEDISFGPLHVSEFSAE